MNIEGIEFKQRGKTNLVAVIGFGEAANVNAITICTSVQAKESAEAILRAHPITLEFGVYDVRIEVAARVGVGYEDIERIPKLLAESEGNVLNGTLLMTDEQVEKLRGKRDE